jgi:hypothetical protein
MRLIQVARHKDEFVHYDQVADILGISHDHLDHSYEMNHALEEISTYEHHEGRPMLTAVVVRKDDFMPGQGFFDLARRLGKLKAGEDRDMFFVRELALVRQYWGEHAPEEGEQLGPTAVLEGSNATGTGLGDEFRVVFHTSMEPQCRSGYHISEKFRTPDNARLHCWVKKRRTRLIPINIFRFANFDAILRDAKTDKVAKKAMKECRGRFFICGQSTIFRGLEVREEMVIQDGGEYYLELRWGSLIQSWRVLVVAPNG